MSSKEKRRTVHLVPYYIQDGTCFVFLQKRSNDATRNPGSISIFGGGVEGNETNEDALSREMNEELNYTLGHFTLLGTYEDEHSISTYYFEEVSADFVSRIKIGEGEYGKFFTEEEVCNESLVSDSSRRVLKDFFNVKQKKT